MYAMCSTKNNDVLACIEEMNKQGSRYSIFQVGQKLYTKYDKDRTKAVEISNSRKRKHIIVITTKTIHKQGCHKLKRYKSENLIQAYLVRPKKAGLKLAHCCM
jgi:hypothetical protein